MQICAQKMDRKGGCLATAFVRVPDAGVATGAILTITGSV
jgi:hypothetical protein